MLISEKLIDQLLDGSDSPDDILGEVGLLKQLTKKVAEQTLNAEMEQHLATLNLRRKARILVNPVKINKTLISEFHIRVIKYFFTL